jgi:NitT/TauT family transport system substrate-binding protein
LVDTVGFATLTVLGAKIALVAGLAWYWVPICSAISCAGGGILLAMVTVQQPRTLQGEPYEEIAVGGGLFMLGGLLIANNFEHSPWIVTVTIFATLFAVFVLRLAVVYYGWRSYQVGNS